MSLCVCGSGLEAAACCDQYLAGKAAPTAEALMRSRYTAYVKGDMDYIERTDSAEALAEFNRADSERVAAQAEWLGLRVVRTEAGGESDNEGKVEFVFSYREKGQVYSQHELSSFARRDGKWLYVDSIVNPKQEPLRVDHIGRNDPCSCGSGKKYKKCCGA